MGGPRPGARRRLSRDLRRVLARQPDRAAVRVPRLRRRPAHPAPHVALPGRRARGVRARRWACHVRVRHVHALARHARASAARVHGRRAARAVEGVDIVRQRSARQEIACLTPSVDAPATAAPSSVPQRFLAGGALPPRPAQSRLEQLPADVLGVALMAAEEP